MLEGQHGGRRQHGDLAIVADGLEGRAHGDFRLAVADVAAEQAIHRRRRFHVVLHVDDGVHLVFGFVELEAVFELALPLGVGGEGVPLGRAARGVELQEFLGHVLHGLLHASLGFLPLLRAQAVQHRLHAFGGTILLHQVEARERHVEARPSAYSRIMNSAVPPSSCGISFSP